VARVNAEQVNFHELLQDDVGWRSGDFDGFLKFDVPRDGG